MRQNEYLWSKGLIWIRFNNSLLHDKSLDWSKFKIFADNKVNLNEKLKIVLGRAENIMGKKKMLATSIFSFSHNVFESLLFRDCVEEWKS